MKFVLLLAEDENIMPEPAKDPAAFAAYMEPWFTYTTALQEAGVLDSGNPLDKAETARTVRVKDGERIVQDGPFIDSTEQLGGYYVIDVDSKDEALDWAAKCPAAANGVVEVRPVWDIPN